MFKKSTKYIKIQRIFNKKAFYGTTPLHTEFPGVPRSENVNYKWTEPTVSNVDGIRVVALESNTPQTSITLSFNSGSRVETLETTGAAAFLKQFAYSATPKYTSVGITRAIEMNTVSFNSSVSKEDISYNATLARYQVDSFFPVLGEVYNHKIREFEVRELETNLLEQSSTLANDPLNLLVDRFHRIAYRGKGLANSVSPFLSRASLEHDEWVEVLREYQRTFFVRERAVVVGVGYSQQELTNLVQTSLEGLAKGSNEAPATTKYNGGENLGDRNGSTHFLIGFEGVPIISPLSHAANLVYTILGGGRKYTKEGPGTGKTSLLNRNLVEKLPTVLSASAYSANYRDSGLFGIYVNAEGELASVVDSVYEQINSLNKVDNSQLESAKKQLKIQLSIYYDSLSRRSELAKRFVQAGLEPVSAQKFIASVDSVSLEDFRRVVKSVFSSRPVLVAEGNIAGLPSTEQLVKKIN